MDQNSIQKLLAESLAYYIEDTRRHVSVDLCDFFGDGVVLTRIYCPIEFRGKKYGSRALQQLARKLDENGVDCYLGINDYGETPGLRTEQLRAWYERHGWVHQKDGMFLRKPNVN